MTSMYDNQEMLKPEEIKSAADVTIVASFQPFQANPSMQSMGAVRADALCVPLSDGFGLPSAREATMAGSLYDNADDTGFRAVEIDFAGIHEEYQQKGIGTRLYKAFAHIALKHARATHLIGETTDASLRARDRVFGADHTFFYRNTTIKSIDPITLDAVDCPGPNVFVNSEEARELLGDNDGHAALLENYREFFETLQEKYGTNMMSDMALTVNERNQVTNFQQTLDQYSLVTITDMRAVDMSGWQADIEIVNGRRLDQSA